MQVDSFERSRGDLASEIQQLQQSVASYEEVTAKRLELVEKYAMTFEEVEQWYNDALKCELDEEEYGLLYMVFYEKLSPDHRSTRFYQMCLEYYLNWLIKGPPPGFEDCELFQDRDFTDLINDAWNYNSKDFNSSHLLFDLQLKFVWYQSGYSIKGLVDEEHAVVTKEYPTNSLQSVVELFKEQLGRPHAQLDETFSRFSRFISTNFGSEYDTLMLEANSIYQKTKKAQEMITANSLESISSLPKKQRDISLVSPVFETSLIQSNTPSIWEQYITILYEFQAPDNLISSTLRRFIRFHPSYTPAYIEALRNIEIEAMTVSEIETRIQKEALLTLLDSQYWSDLVVALLLANEKLGRTEVNFQQYFKQALERQDVFHSVERVIATIFEKRGELVSARKVYEQLTNTFTSEAEGWLVSYNFERRHGDLKQAYRVLVAAVNRAEQLDWPERIFEEALRFQELYGDVETYRSLKVRIQKKKKDVEAIRAASAENIAAEHLQELEIDVGSNKRKADDISDSEDMEVESTKKTETTRDRENLTVAVRNLPANVQEKTITSFFKDCGPIREIKIIQSEASSQANVEFTEERDVLRALTKDYKYISGNEIRVQRLQQNTLFVTNFPPTFTKDDLNQLFTPVGPVAAIRLPSLKFNTQRRFAYVEYLDSSNAQAAVGLLNGKDVDGFFLSVQISDPTSKQNRSGAAEEGRELYIKKLDFFKVTTNKVKLLFEKYGTVESVHLPLSDRNRALNKKHDGYGFVVFKTAEEAQAAVQGLNMATLEGRAIEVSIAEKKSLRAKKEESRALKDYSNSENAIAVVDLPDTVSRAQLEEFFSTVGEVEDVVLEPKVSGAIIVFKDSNAAGSASLKIEGATLGDYKVRITTVKNMRLAGAPIKKTHNGAAPMIPSNLRRRQLQAPTHMTKTHPAATSPAQTTTDAETKPPRSNADFRAMLFGKK
ncbi:28 kDa ribonucleoprotein, chloroplastic [Cyberlindnera fabianii]|uniref:28 kDa ribonucleoprotein, chloroplastic n=1 Tax=Cyberlindnera fabianii TaxID=36022 RepID=A0A1V2L5D0_CYBFA|nr:28 kDa ribonucleoprotein, chloroplastic [Cyberlindnera fabianii]